MTLGEIIKNYRTTHNISQRQFATASQLSNGYISMIEEDSNPKTGEPIIPSIVTLRKIASGMGISLNDLLAMADDMPVSIAQEQSAPGVNIDGGRAREFSQLFLRLTAEQQSLVISQIKGILSDQ